MHLWSLRRGAFRFAAIACLVVSLGGIGAIAAVGASASSLSGTWSETYGGTYHGTFTLHWTQSGSTLHGSIKITYSGQSATTTVSGKVSGDSISFGAVGPAGAVSYDGLGVGQLDVGPLHDLQRRR